MALLERDVLSICRSLYEFAAGNYVSTKQLWPSAARECHWLSILVRTIKMDLTLPWSSLVSCSDACLTGIGTMYSRWPQSIVQQHGRISEKWRYKSAMRSIRAREHALVGRDVFADVSTVKNILLPHRCSRAWKQ